jgi:hypothetical protein
MKRESTYFDFYKNQKLEELKQYKQDREKEIFSLKSIKRATKKD